MIRLTRLNGDQFALNDDLIERIDARPDTVITLTDDTHYVVTETVDEVIEAMLSYRAQILAHANLIQVNGDGLVHAPKGLGSLALVPGTDERSE